MINLICEWCCCLAVMRCIFGGGCFAPAARVSALLAGLFLTPPAFLFWAVMPLASLIVLPGLVAAACVYVVFSIEALPLLAANGLCVRTHARIGRAHALGWAGRSCAYGAAGTVGFATMLACVSGTRYAYSFTRGGPIGTATPADLQLGLTVFVTMGVGFGFLMLAAMLASGAACTAVSQAVRLEPTRQPPPPAGPALVAVPYARPVALQPMAVPYVHPVGAPHGQPVVVVVPHGAGGGNPWGGAGGGAAAVAYAQPSHAKTDAPTGGLFAADQPEIPKANPFH